MRISGAFPVRWAAKDGAPGTGVTIVQSASFTKYAASSSGTSHPSSSSSNWNTSVPSVANGNYLWTWVHVQYSDGTGTDSYSVSRMGVDGKGIVSSITKYCQKANTNSRPEAIAESDWGSFPTNLVNDYWLYSRTIVTYSDGDTATSYNVSQIGQGSYYAGCQEYYAVSNDGSNAPSGYPNTKDFVDGVANYTNGEQVSVNSPWSTSKPSANNSNPYIWNFEISYDSRGNKYVTRPICIGNFSKGISSIVETYTISSHSSVSGMLANTTERTSYPWSDEQHAVAPTESKPYQWNKTVISYNDGPSDTIYHISAVKGADGKGSTYIDLDNENDSMLYDAAGNLVGGTSGWVTSNISLYSNGSKVTSTPTFSIKERSSSISSSNAVISGSTLTIKGLLGNSGYVIVACTYNSVEYTAKMTVKKLVGQDKYELQLNHTALSYNETQGALSNTTIAIEVYRTAQNGSREKVIGGSMASYQLNAMLYPNGGSSGSRSISFDQSTGNGSVNITASDATSWTNFAIVLFKNGTEVDRETVPINKVRNGERGPGAIILDLDNENDSMLYDAAGTLKSGNVTSQGRLLDGGVDKTSEVTSWRLADKSNVTGSISNSGLISISSVSASSGSAVAYATYGGVEYKAKITIKKIIGYDKYELVCTPNALTYNTTKATNPQQVVNVKVYRTGQNGTRSLVTSLSTYNLTLRYYWQQSESNWGGPTQISDGSATGNYSSGVNRTLYANQYYAYRFELLDSNGNVLDVETVPISKNSDGEGKDAIILDLDNENDTMLYDGDDIVVSDPIVSTGSLFKGPEKVTSGITWSIQSAEGCTLMNSGTATNSSYARSTYPSAAWINTSGLVKVNGLTASQGKVVVCATYGGNTYTATLTLKKLRTPAKYDLVIKPAALSYNSSTNLINGASSANVVVEIWRTAQDGSRSLVDDYNGANKYGLSVSVSSDGGSTISPTAKSYGVDFSVNSSFAQSASSISVIVKKGTMTYDSETIPIAKTTNGSGAPGPAAKSIYRLAFEKPSTPTGASPQGTSVTSWHDDPVTQDAVKIDLQGDWMRDTDGYLRAPAVGTYQSIVETLSFVTTASNQKIYIRVKCTIASGSYIKVGNLDATSPSTSTLRTVSGSNQDTNEIEITVPYAGTHFICVMYYRAGGNDSFAKFACGNMNLWQSNAKTFNSNGTVSTWSAPFLVGSESPEDVIQTKANILKQTAFLPNMMDAWSIKNGATTDGTQGRNAYSGVADYGSSFKELLKQSVWDPSGDKPLLPNTWYTLSFWAKANPYIQIDKNETSNAYGFARVKPVYFEAGVTNTIWVNGYVSSAAHNAGKSLRVFVYGDGETDAWGSTITSVSITSTSTTTASATFTVPVSGWYHITAYVYLEPNGSNSAVDGHTARVNWYRIDRGMKLYTYLYPDCSNGEQSSYTAIDTEAGRIADGKHISSTPSDNGYGFKLSEDWTKHTLIFKTRGYIPTKQQNFLIRMSASSNNVLVCMPKLEQGTQPTDYCTNDRDGADLAIEETGFPNDRGQWVESPGTPYQWNDTSRDYVASSVSGEWKRYFVKKKGMVVPNGTAPSSGGNTYWEEGSRISVLLVNTIVGANAELTFAKSNRILVTNASGNVAAGMGGAENGDNDYPLWVGANYANRGNAPFRVTLSGKLYAMQAEITGKITGSVRNPFMLVDDSFSTYDKDNLVMMTNGGGWTYVFSLPWGVNQSGRVIRLISYKWSNSESPAEGWGSISAPSGYYFYENGRRTNELKFSREMIELVGYGSSSTFFGWIVVRRLDLMAESAYGIEQKCLLMGRLVGTTSGVSLSKYCSFDNSTISVTRTSEGLYRVTIPTSWKIEQGSLMVQATPIGASYGSNHLLYCSVESIQTTTVSGTAYVSAINLQCSDDMTRNDGSMFFAVYNMNDWSYLQ